MADWATISSLATAGGTLVLAAATYSAVRSANRSAAIAEQTREIGLRPVLVNSRLQDPAEKIGWQDDHWTKVPGGGATAEIVDLLYTDHEGGQRAISRFAMLPRPDSGYMCTVVRHWNLDRQDPR